MSLIFDYFAGGGGVSEGIRQALERGPDVAVNHCEHALAMHAKNHPATVHLKECVWNIHPVRDLPAGDVDLLWLSPSCTHFSRARGGKPVSKQLRSLPWVAARVAARRRPAVIVLENVVEFRKWGPVDADGNPIKARVGATFRRFVRRLESLGYVVEDRVLDAADYGAATHRKRLFLIARRDGLPIAWPEPSHGPGRPLPYKTAGDCVDWAKPLPSIFGRKRMHRPATHRRIAEALKRHLFETQEPFLVQVNHGRDKNRSRALSEPLPTITMKHGFALIVPTLVQTGYGERKGQRPRALDVHQPLGTIVAGAQKHALIGACLIKYYGTSKKGASLRDPLPTITAQGQHMAVVAAFLETHYGAADQPLPLSKAIARVLEEAKTGVVTVEIGGVRYAIVDIGLRMLSPRELARCQGFTDDYVLTGTQEQQVARIGNSVPPPLAAAIVRANVAPRPRLVPRPRQKQAA